MDKRGKVSFWDFLIWTGIALVLIWILLKTFGVMNSPIWFEMLPFYGLVGTSIGMAYKFGQVMENINHRFDRTDEKINQLLEMKEDLIKVKQNQFLCMEGKLRNSGFRKGF